MRLVQQQGASTLLSSQRCTHRRVLLAGAEMVFCGDD